MTANNPSALAEALKSGDRRALARAITLVESTRADHRAEAEALLSALGPANIKALRIGISGAPGAGKSTFIEAFGSLLTGQGRKVAVLAVDPSSALGGGSILGDKTRMERLSRDSNAFIRPQPSSGALGGVARRTREAILLVEAAGFDIVLVETVGVGQSEISVNDLVDFFVLLVTPGGGDDLQGIKRGIMELADLLVVTKADGALLKTAGTTAADYQAALHLMRPKYADWPAKVVQISALEGHGLEAVLTAAEAHRDMLMSRGLWQARRADQARAALTQELQVGILEWFMGRPGVTDALKALETEVAAGRLPPALAARRLLGRLDEKPR